MRHPKGRVKLTVYVTPVVAEKLRKKAEANGTSVSAEANDRLVFATGSYVV